MEGKRCRRFEIGVLLIVAGSAGSIAGCIIGALSGAAVHSIQTGEPYDPWGMILIGVIFAFVGGPLAAIALGAALHAFLLDCKAVSLWQYTIAGAAPGVLAAVGRGDPYISLIIGLSGICTATCFWLIRRPDRDQPPNVTSG